MPVVQSIDGVITPYKDRSGNPRQREPKPRKNPGANTPQPPTSIPLATGPTVSALQQAYQLALTPKTQRGALVARDLMSSPAVTLLPDSMLSAAWDLMKTKGIRHIPIVSELGTIVGILSDRDLLSQSSSSERFALPPVQAKTAMTTQLFTATPTTPIQEVVGVMLNEWISALPILDEVNRPIGIVTTSDILRIFMNHAPLEVWT